MTWRTHAAIGANAIWLTGIADQADETIVILLPVAILASLLPDIDAISAKIHYIGGGVLHTFKGAFHGEHFHHRGFMHSIFATLIFFLVLLYFFYQSLPMLPYVFALSYFSHPLIDGLNTNVGYLYPFVRRKFALVPKVLRSPVGGAADNFLLIVGVFGLLLFFLTYATKFIPNLPGDWVL